MHPRIINSSKYEIMRLENAQMITLHDSLMMGPDKMRELYNNMKLDMIGQIEPFVECRQEILDSNGYKLSVFMYVAKRKQ
jgi:hypothetical protein